MKSKKLVWGLLFGFAVWMVVAFFGLMQVESHAASSRYDKISVDNTPLFIYTDKITGCRYVYNASTGNISTAQGFEHCPIPESLQ